jgi:hypothetical protein
VFGWGNRDVEARSARVRGRGNVETLKCGIAQCTNAKMQKPGHEKKNRLLDFGKYQAHFCRLRQTQPQFSHGLFSITHENGEPLETRLCLVFARADGIGAVCFVRLPVRFVQRSGTATCSGTKAGVHRGIFRSS